MKIILAMAISANGIIATKDGSEDFLSHENWNQFVSLAKNSGGFVWGRKTYENVMSWGNDYLDPLDDVHKIVLSKTSIKLQDGFQLALSPQDVITKFKNLGLKKALVTGGATVNSEFAKKALIDEIIFYVNPSIVGDGIPVFKTFEGLLDLKLIESENLPDGIIKLQYAVQK